MTNPPSCQEAGCLNPPEHDVPRCTIHLHSGFNPNWTSSLGEMEPPECRDFMANLAEMPLKKCNALVGCSENAEWYVDFHGCEGVCTCGEHKDIWVYEINSVLSDRGEVHCPGCDRVFTILPRIMNWRKI